MTGQSKILPNQVVAERGRPRKDVAVQTPDVNVAPSVGKSGISDAKGI